METRNALGNLVNRYTAVLKKCHLLNTFGSLAIASALMAGTFSDVAIAGDFVPNLDDSAVQMQVKESLKAISPSPTPPSDFANWIDYVNNLQISSAYTVTDITSEYLIDPTIVANYHTTFTTKELDASNVYQDVVYGIKLKGYNYGRSGNTDTYKDTTSLVIDYITKQSQTITDTNNTTYYSSISNVTSSITSPSSQRNAYTFSINVGSEILYFAVDKNGTTIPSTSIVGTRVDSVTENVKSNFINNSTDNVNGGAIFNNANASETAAIESITGDFINNSVQSSNIVNGGAIYNFSNGGTAIIGSIKGDFIANKVTVTGDPVERVVAGGAVYNNGGITSLTGDFIGNSVSAGALQTQGGGIFNAGTISSITGNFFNNSSSGWASYSGAIDNSGTITSLTGDFIGNSSIANWVSAGGAIQNSATINTIIGDFIGNSATTTNSYNNFTHGGAIYNAANATINTLIGDFISNSVIAGSNSASGGAIHNIGSIGIMSGSFIGNSVTAASGTALGGAIFTNASLSFLANGNSPNVFSGNFTQVGSAAKDYNAIYISEASKNLSFNMQGTGGFVFNDNIKASDTYTVNITGSNATNNIFQLNNEWHNASAVTLNNATLHMGTGPYGSGSIGNANLTVTGISALSGNVVISGTANFNGTTSINGTTTFANTANFASSSTLIVDANTFTNNSVLSGNNTALTVEAGAKIQVANGATGDVIQIASGFANPASSIATGAWEGANLTSTSSLQVLKVTDFDRAVGTYSVEITSLSPTPTPTPTPTPSGVDKILHDYAQMGRGSAELIVNFSQRGTDVNSTDVLTALFSRIFTDGYIGSTKAELATLTFEGLMQVANSAGTGTNSLALNGITLKNLRSRFNNILPSTSTVYLEDIRNQNQGLSAGSETSAIKNGFAVWATPFYSHTNISGIDAGSFESGSESNLGGLSIGTDYTFQNMFRFGLALNGGGGSSESNGDFNKSTNDFGFIGASLYGAMYYNNFTLSADLGYTFVNNEVEMSLPTLLGYSQADADMDSNTFTLGAEASYLFETQLLDIIPYIGLRYTNIHTSAYDTKVSGATVVHTDSDSQDIFSLPVGVTLSKEFMTANSWNITPSLDLGMTYSFGDLEATSTSSIPTVVGNSTYHVENVDEFAFNGGIGLQMAKDNVSFGLDYDLQASRHETSHTVQATLRYKF